MRDLQTELVSNRQLALVWWIPLEYWQVALAANKDLGAATREQLLRTIAKFDLVAIVQAEISPLGAFDYYPRTEVIEGLRFTHLAADGARTAMAAVEPQGDAQLLLAQLTPVLKAAVGNLGCNLQFFVYTRSKGKRVLDPTAKGVLEFSMQGRDAGTHLARIETPINALFVPRLCADGRPTHVSWTHCPWDGNRLGD